ncbi:MAG: SEC-C metal-binding domain-containing protein [Syntrophobacteraceae bacterium]
MEHVFIWSEAQLSELLESPNPDIQEWAVARLYGLYPDSAESRTASLLQSGSETIVLTTLRQLDKRVRPECIPLLKRIYAEGGPEVRTLALHVLSNWRVEEAIEWVRDKVFSGARFSSEEIAAMIRMLGLIPGEKSYDLLKGTEGAVQKERSWKWQVFYAAILRHGKSEDLGTLIAFLMNQEEPDEHRMAAVGLLLERVDPTLNPTDVYYGNHPAVRTHLLGRLEYLDACTKGTARPASQNPVFLELAKAIGVLRTDGSDDTVALLVSISATHAMEVGFLAELSSRSIEAIQSGSTPPETVFCLCTVAISALIQDLFERLMTAPGPDAPWERQLDYVLQYPREWETADPEWRGVFESSPREALIARLAESVATDLASWKSLHAVEMLGELKAAEAAPAIVKAMEKDPGEYGRETASAALSKMGVPILPELLPLLDSADASLRETAMGLLCRFPTPEVVSAVSSRMATLLEQHRVPTLAACEALGAQELLSVLEPEYRPGEWDLARTCTIIAHLHGLKPSLLAEMERDLKEGEHYRRASRTPGEIPSKLRLELLCNECGKRYHYLVNEVHLHPPGSKDEQKESETEQDMIPYRQGIVIADDIHCKNCQTLNDFSLTPTAMAQLSSHGMMMQTMSRLGLEIPGHNPLQIVRLPDKQGRERSLIEIEQEHSETVGRHPRRPESHLAMGKFYEYVKRHPEAKEAYFLAVDMEPKALEAMAGLARLYHAEGKLADAFSWIDQCYKELPKGRIFLAEDPSEFKSAVREKRREYGRDAGIRPDEDAVDIRFHVETSDYPKNRPCPCGSGKKYKVCCMKSESR